jgi:two-component system, NarL family, response regulator NreC
MRPRVLVADDHPIMVEGLSRLLGEACEVVGVARTGPEVVENARRLRPDLVVSDVSMPGMSGIDAMRTLREEGSQARFVFLTFHAEARVVADALRYGASGYLLKEAAGDELLHAIQAVMAERTYVMPQITEDVLRLFAAPARGGAPELSPRKREILALIARGKRMKEIAAELDISIRTVEDHKYQLMRALGVESTAELVRFAVKLGL